MAEVTGARRRIIVALDTPEVQRAVGWVAALREHVGAFKVGLEFLHAAGPEGVQSVQAAGAGRLFIDAKLSDIPNTVAGAVRSLCRLRPWIINVHAMAGPAAMREAREAAAEAGEPRTLLLAVTVLTSLDSESLAAIGCPWEVEEAVVRLAVLARESGMDGVVASPLEIEAVRRACGPDFLIVTPGVRLRGAAVQDQARVATPGDAVRAGADYLVIGRALTAAPDPAAAADAIAAEIGAIDN